MDPDPRVVNFLNVLAREYQEEAKKEMSKNRKKKKKNDRKWSSGIV